MSSDNAQMSATQNRLIGPELESFVDSALSTPQWKSESDKFEAMEANCRAAFARFGRSLHRVSPDEFVALARTDGEQVTKICEWYCGDVGFVFVRDLSGCANETEIPRSLWN